jgi:hypothetical protein
MNTSELRLNNTIVNEMTDNFFGKFVILPGQYSLLDNQVIELTPKNLRIIVGGNPNKMLDYSVADTRLRYYEGRPINALEIRIDNLSKVNINPGDDILNLIVDLLYLRTPSIIYMTYEEKNKVFTLKNLNMATIAVLQKI